MNKHTDEDPTALKDDVAEKDSINSNDENESFENFEDATNHEIVHSEEQQLIRKDVYKRQYQTLKAKLE